MNTNPYSKTNLRKNIISFCKRVNVKIRNKSLDENIKNLFVDIFFSTNWGVEKQTFKVDSDDEILQKRIDELNTDEHKMLGELLMSTLIGSIPQGSK